jgi:hypothetical protein
MKSQPGKEMKVASDSAMVRALRRNTLVTIPINFEEQSIPVEPPQSEPVMQSASLAEQEATGNTNALQIPPQVMHLTPYPYFLRHQSLPAPLAWGAPPFHHTIDQQLTNRKRVALSAIHGTLQDNVYLYASSHCHNITAFNFFKCFSFIT